MKITAVRATWLCAPIPAEHAHVSDFGRNDTFNMCLVEIEPDVGLIGLGEAKAGVGNVGNYAAMVTLIREGMAPVLLGRDPRDITGIWETLYNGSRAHYATREGRTFPTMGRRGLALCAISGIDIACWDLLGRSLGQPVWRLLGGKYRERIPPYASGGGGAGGAPGQQKNPKAGGGPRPRERGVGGGGESERGCAARGGRG